MITVSILINGQPIYARTAVNIGKNADGKHIYKIDDGSILSHTREEGALALAKMMLDTVEEVK